jgi:hypothetical protein
VLETRRTGYDRSGKPFVLTISVYPADRNEFVIDVGDVPEEAATSAVSKGDTASEPPAGSAQAVPGGSS